MLAYLDAGFWSTVVIYTLSFEPRSRAVAQVAGLEILPKTL
jgi:hypothetical protein